MTAMTPFISETRCFWASTAWKRRLERVAKAGDSYPPYNIERLPGAGESPDRLRITLAVAGFTRGRPGCVGGREPARGARPAGRGLRETLSPPRHRSQAVPAHLCSGRRMQVTGADLKNGLLANRSRSAQAGTVGKENQHFRARLSSYRFVSRRNHTAHMRRLVR